MEMNSPGRGSEGAGNFSRLSSRGRDYSPRPHHALKIWSRIRYSNKCRSAPTSLVRGDAIHGSDRSSLHCDAKLHIQRHPGRLGLENTESGIKKTIVCRAANPQIFLALGTFFERKFGQSYGQCSEKLEIGAQCYGDGPSTLRSDKKSCRKLYV